MPDRSGLEDKAMAAGLIALGAAIPIYESLTERVREFGATPAGRALGLTVSAGATVAGGALKGVKVVHGLVDRRAETSKSQAA